MNKLIFPGLSGYSASYLFFRHPPVLEAERILLRPMRVSDARDIFDWAKDPTVARYVLWDAHKDVRESRDYSRYIRRLYREGLPSSWGIQDKQSEKIIGTIGIMAWYPDHKNCEIGYSLGRNWWGLGIMTEAVTRLTRSLFTELDLNRIEAQHDTRNPASGRVLEKCGFHREGLLRSRIVNGKETVDTVMWAALKKDIFP